MNVGVVGTGHVGLVTGACLAEKGHRVRCVDNDRAKIAMLRRSRMPIYEPGLEALVRRHVRAGRLTFGTSIPEVVDRSLVIFICVGTPPLDSGAPDMSYVEHVVREIAPALRDYRVIAEKSTVPVQTGQRLRAVIQRYLRRDVPFDVVSNPEFLREGSAVRDTLQPDRVVVGVSSRRAEKVMRELYRGFKAPFIVTDVNSAELIKHASNSFLALKISYINSVARICELSGGNVAEVARGMGLDPRIGDRFLSPGIGYGGSCFPKDVAAFATIASQIGYDFGILREVQRVNADARELFVKRIEEELWILKGKTVGVLGLSFKPDTDDVREAPALTIIGRLQEKGARIRAYDPVASAKAKPHLPGVRICRSAYEAARGADCLALTTEWGEFRTLDLKRLKRVMAHPTVVDGRNLWDPEVMRRAGFTYRSVGRP